MVSLISRRASAGGFSNLFGGFGSWNRVAPSSIWISKKRDLGSFSSSNLRIINSPYSNFIGGGGIRKISTRVSDESPSVQKERISSPWLTLPPAFEGGDMYYKFYSLAENKVLSFKNKCRELELSAEDTVNLSFVGSSHGWLALFNKRNCDLFLYNPISGSHINLPSYNNLPLSKDGYAEKLTISCSPDEEDCRAILSYSNEGTLAFCCPGRSLEWALLMKVSGYDSSFVYPDHLKNEPGVYCNGRYWSFAYSSRQKLFFSTSFQNEMFQAWDLGGSDPRSWKKNPMMDDVWVEEGKHSLLYESQAIMEQFFVITEHSGRLYLLRRFVDCTEDYNRTTGFDVHKYNPNPMDLVFKYMDPTNCSSCLDDLVFFIGGNNTGFALRANEFPELKPNSIYFTDPSWYDPEFDGYDHDIGIYNYKDGTISSSYYPSDERNSTPSHIWSLHAPINFWNF